MAKRAFDILAALAGLVLLSPLLLFPVTLMLPAALSTGWHRRAAAFSARSMCRALHGRVD